MRVRGKKPNNENNGDNSDAVSNNPVSENGSDHQNNNNELIPEKNKSNPQYLKNLINKMKMEQRVQIHGTDGVRTDKILEMDEEDKKFLNEEIVFDEEDQGVVW